MARNLAVTQGSLLAATLAGVAAAFGTLFYPVDAPVGGDLPNTFSVSVRAPRGGIVTLSYDFGAGLNGALSSSAELGPRDAFARVALPLPAGTIVFLRLSLPDGPPQAAARNAQILDSRGRLLRQFADSDLRPDGAIVLRTNLTLPTDPRNPEAVVRRERVAAVLLAAAELAALLAIWRRPRGTPLPAWLERAAIGLAAAAILFSRRPSVFVAPQFWCEDGTIYFLGRNAGVQGLWAAQGNYIALVPRTVAALAALAPALYAPILYAAAAVAVCLAAALKAASPRVGLPLPVFAGLAVVLVPNMDEITANLTNEQWFGAVILVLVCLSQPPADLLQAARDTAALVLFGLTGPFIIFALPLLAWRAARTRSAGAWMLAALGAALAVLQYFEYRTSQPAALPAKWPHLIPFLGAAGYRTGGQLFGLMRSPLIADPVPLGLAGLALYLAIWLLFPLRGRLGEIRPALAWIAFAVMAGGFLRYAHQANLFFEPVFVVRYFYVALLFGAWLMLGGLAVPGPRRWLALLGLCAAVACNLPSYRMAPYIDLDWPHYASAIERGEPVYVPINPPAWGFDSPGRLD
jgi:hypothetical protein